MADSIPDEVRVMTAHTNSVLHALSGVDDVMAMNALISAFANKAYSSGKRLGASAVLQQLGRRLQYCATPAEFARGPAQEPRRIPVPTIAPAEHQGYSEEDLQAIRDLCHELSITLEGYANHVGLSGLLSIYIAAAESSGDLLAAAQHLIHTGSKLVQELGAGIPTPDSSTKH